MGLLDSGWEEDPILLVIALLLVDERIDASLS